MAVVRNPARRRQRSVRVTVSVVLLAAATAGVVLAIPTQSPVLLSVAAVAAIVLAWAALRMMWTEVLQSRREHAHERVAVAEAYEGLFSQRADEHAEFTTTMTERLADTEQDLAEAELELVESTRTKHAMAQKLERIERRAQLAEDRAVEDARALEDALGRLQTLEEELAARDEVAELVEWDQKNSELSSALEQKTRDAVS